ncbi:hypothetical protein PIB30_061047 [Stylosanthes scabra]|uniref:Uncharacterized protein n=1 Tax=Stylosanthes scabra TaxID=79078 RepID=A0ABU6SKR8_9FABA|nr:hypothetical protein [Stylosanthes scabra]
MRETQKRFESQLNHITELLHKFANQPTINPQPYPSTSTPLPSQPLPNPKGAELTDSDDSDDEEVEEEPEKEVNTEVVEEETKGEIFFIATIFSGKKVAETEILIKCEDLSPCLVTCKIRGVDIPECLCDPGACGSVMPYALYETLDLGLLKKSKEFFTTADASIKLLKMFW